MSFPAGLIEEHFHANLHGMAYEVTATRRRPQRFEDMIGQDFVVATLQKSIAAGKIAHAYLFSGPRGCGKTSSARILAKALNCQTGPGTTPCGTCAACLEITRGSSLDVIEIDGASNTSVNDVRQIKDEVQFPPNSCRYKVYIIDEVHMLSTSAFNALLKTIEEPPPYVIFIFATTEIHKVPATIKSRCQQFNFRLVSVDQLKEVLAEAASETGIKADDEALFWVAREATGSVRDAYTLFDQVAAFSDGHLTFEKIRDKLGLVGVDRINRIAEACALKNSLDALSALDETLQNGVSVEQFTVDMADYFRNLLLIKSGLTREALLGQSAERFSAAVLERWSAVQIERALSLMLQLYRDIRYSLDPRFELELAVSRLSWISDYVSSAEMKTALDRAQNLLLKGNRNGSPDGRSTGNGVSRGKAGPFSEADRSPLPSRQETVRTPSPSDPAPPAVSAAGTAAGAAASFTSAVHSSAPAAPVRAASADEEDPEVRIENPFAAFKQRLGGHWNAAPQDTPAAPVTSAASTVHAATPVPAPAVPAAAPVPAVTVPVTAVQGASPVPAGVVDEYPDEPPETAALPEGSVGIDRLRDSVVQYFQATKNMVATSLSQSFDWIHTGSTVKFSVDKPFVHNFLEQEHKAIAEAVSRLLGVPAGIEIHLDASKKELSADAAEMNRIPPQVEMVKHMFKGSIVGEGRQA